MARLPCLVTFWSIRRAGATHFLRIRPGPCNLRGIGHVLQQYHCEKSLSMKPRLLALLAILTPTFAMADGLLRDLSTLTVDTTRFSPGQWEFSQEPDRATYICLDCAGGPIIDIQTGRQTDGTEGRVRSGQTTFDALQAQCQARDPSCRLEGLDLGPAVGWVTSYGLGDQAAHTIVVIRDGDLITARILSSDATVARQNADAVIAHILPAIIGQ
jgi:hypothetical protein